MTLLGRLTYNSSAIANACCAWLIFTSSVTPSKPLPAAIKSISNCSCFKWLHNSSAVLSSLSDVCPSDGDVTVPGTSGSLSLAQFAHWRLRLPNQDRRRRPRPVFHARELDCRHRPQSPRSPRACLRSREVPQRLSRDDALIAGATGSDNGPPITQIARSESRS